MSEPAKRILCVEDDPDTQDLLRLLLQEQGYRFTAVGNCADALRAMREGGADLVLMDNLLPDGNGLDLCQQVRSFDKQVPIIFLSGSTHEDEHRIALETGANAFLVKPFTLDELFTLVSHHAPVQ